MNDIENILTTNYIYLKVGNLSINVKDKEYVYKNDLIMSNETNKVYSTVSGNILGLTKIYNQKYIVIENDYKDKIRKRYNKRNINNYSKEELNELNNEFLVIEDFDITSKVLIINGLDSYNEDITFNTLIKEYTINILDTIDALIDIMGIKKCFFAVSNMDTDTVNVLVNNMGTYPKIDLNLYKNDNIISNKKILINKLTNYKNKNYKVQYLDIIDIINIYNLLKKHIPVTRNYITLAGNLLNTKKVLQINIGSNIKDILNEFNIDNKNIIVNGLLSGKKISDTNFILDKNIKSIYIEKEKKYKTVDCINCGLCTSICPVNINPKYMYFNNNNKSENYKNKCINCGICSYVCPSKINLTKGSDKI